jgi:periplasmic divalent cation tolerance protein
MSDKILVLVTVGSLEKGEEMARTLVEERLAACVNMVPGIRSFYRWEGKVTDDAELLLLIKTRAVLFDTLKERVLALHSYDLPEVVALSIEKGHQPYLDWIDGETRAIRD